MGPIGCPETTVRNYHYSLRNNPEDRSSELLRGGSLKSRATCLLLRNLIQTKFVANNEAFIFSTFFSSPPVYSNNNHSI
jgi:hypothetical protein